MKGEGVRKEKLIKELSQIYIGKNPQILVREYYKKKHKEMMVIIAAGIVVIALCILKDLNNSTLEKEYGIIRNKAGEGKESIILQIKAEEEPWKEIEIDLYPKEYSKEELEDLFLKANDALVNMIKKENTSLTCVDSDLDLIQEIEGYPFLIQWTSTPEGIIDENGKLMVLDRAVNEVIELTAVFEYEDWKKEKRFYVRVIKETTKDFITSLGQRIKVTEADTREEDEFYLPEVFENKQLQWRYPLDNTGFVIGVLFILLIPFIAYEKDKEIFALSLKRKKQLQDSFPEFITKLTLLLEAGLSIQGAIFHIVEDYQKASYDKKIYLYEELSYICRQMKNGMSQKDGYGLLAKRCPLSCYKKIAGILTQHLYKGGNHILEELKMEALRAGEEQKRALQKKGEEMGAKLLFPMFLMLGVVMVFIMVPALFSFQIS